MERTYTILGDSTESDLRTAMNDGRDFSCNNSPTCRAKIVDIVGRVCTLEVVPHPESYMQEYNVKAKGEIGKQFTIPAYIAWNAIYF
jgi:hypothetical protein